MRTLFKYILALLVLAAAPVPAYAHVEINIDLSSQTMTVHSGTGETYVWPISSGRAGYPTPRGVFRPRALYVMVHSAKYGNAPMPHSIFFYGQYAIHGTNAVGNLGGWLGPTVYGLAKDATGSSDIGLLCLAIGPLVTAIAVVLAGHDRRLERLRVQRA